LKAFVNGYLKTDKVLEVVQNLKINVNDGEIFKAFDSIQKRY